MNAGHAATLCGIVHARQVVKEKRSGVEVFERDGQVFGVSARQAVRRRHLKDQPRANQAAGIVQHMAKRFL